VNLLADNLTNQVRAIAQVATAGPREILTRSIQVEASGEVAELKDNINTMIITCGSRPTATRNRIGSRPTLRASPECCRTT